MDILDVLKAVFTHKIITVHGTEITGVSVLGMAAILVASVLVSKYAQHLVRAWCERRADLDPGLSFTAARLTHYLIVCLGAIVAVDFVGVNLTSLAVVVSFLSVGVGFGLQNIASNFIAGLIILFERPIKPGDRVTVGDTNGDVQRINLRSTVIRTIDNITIIVPNSRFISDEVINWSYGDPNVRLRIPVGVAYGSDVERVRRTLLDVARRHPSVLAEPASDVWLTGFGDSSLDFELLVWVSEPQRRRRVISDLNFGIEEAFRREGIEIPFPQRDVHIIEKT